MGCACRKQQKHDAPSVTYEFFKLRDPATAALIFQFIAAPSSSACVEFVNAAASATSSVLQFIGIVTTPAVDKFVRAFAALQFGYVGAAEFTILIALQQPEQPKFEQFKREPEFLQRERFKSEQP